MNANGHNQAEPSSSSSYLERLGELASRGKLIIWARGVLTAASVAIASMVLFLLALGWWGGPILRVVGWFFFIGATVAALIFAIVRPLRRLATPERVARRVGSVAPKRESMLLSAAHFASLQAPSGFSPELLSRHQHEAQRTLISIPSGKVFPLKTLIWSALLFLSVVAFLGLASKGAPQVMESGAGMLWKDPAGAQKVVSKVVKRTPVLGDLSVTLRYPDYFDREARTLVDTSGGFVAPIGTTVIMKGRSLVPGVRDGEICLPGGERRRLLPKDDGFVAGRFVVNKAGDFWISLDAEEGVVEGPPRSVEVEKDSPPVVRLLRPTKDVETDEDGEVVMEFEAQDDHGVSRVDLVIHGETGKEVRKTVMRLADGISKVGNRIRWSPQSHRLDGMGSLTMELEAFDDDTILGPKPGRSRAIGVRVMTRKGRHERVLARQGELLDALVDLLAVRLEEPPKGKGHSPEEIKARFTVLRSKTEDLLGKTARLIHELNQDPLTGRTVTDTFIKIREDLSNQLLHEARLHRGQVADFKKRQGVDRVTVRLIEDAVIRLDDLVLDQQFGDLVGSGSALEQARSKLMELLERYARTRAESSRRAVLEMIERMEEMAARIAGDMELVRGKVGDVFVNNQALDVVDLSGMLGSLKDLLAKGDVEGALGVASAMERRLGRLVTGLETGRMAFRTDRFGEGEQFVGELMDRLMALEAGQLQLRRKTIALRRRIQERIIGIMKGKIDPLVKRQLASVERLREDLGDLGKQLGSGSRRDTVASAKVMARELELALGQGDLDEARTAAGRLKELVDEIGDGEDDPPKRVRVVARQCEEILAEIDGAFPRPSQIFMERDSASVRKQSVKQRHLHSKVLKIKRWVRNQGEVTSFLSHRVLGQLDRVGKDMNQGVTHLEGKDIRAAAERQTEALDGLARIRRDLRSGNESTPLESRPVILEGELALPDPEEFQVPKEHREDILEAMKSELPGLYGEAIKRYYETLVR